ncbi:preprotein translocase subunit YajC [Bartonella henselae]|uniref:Sec translocon accessory complex subunit YajC n=1 Tax=Bartonella henselae TaxID=38323 RepID=X5MF34_BARHN|nr:preprotein translocase subunit YajC [Bartonella henselae]MDM9996301.1 preprotein translocase subunit YajC [Bartonella henselae]OLL48385.1 preprotein translocase subunit YajC [Bartonella henselae]OLL48713.1 preprotein translocase subunit YajC [Bartonella henselae]OLL49807.1 preprotein translocase subunit YajC [Bartonella henselae]OLL57360.1 preprotein translocase subunit YajC [Bartonella henselae]
MFITNAYAQVTGGVSNGPSLVTFVPFILIFGIMYFFIIRPQRAQMKKRQEMLNAVRRGDTVITGGGVIGKVTKVYDESGELEVEICDGMRIRVIRSTLSDVRVKGEPISEEKSKLNTKVKAPSKAKAVKKENMSASKEKKAVSKEEHS